MKTRGLVVVAVGLGLAFAACSGSSSPNIGSGAGTSSGASGTSGSGTSGGGSSGQDPGPRPDDGGSLEASTDARPDAPPNDGRCPPAYGSEVVACEPRGLVCRYPEGTCECVPPCGGAPPPDDRGQWSCRKREDGCPERPPPENKACTMAGLRCDYGGCCGERFVCAGGVWTRLDVICPPIIEP